MTRLITNIKIYFDRSRGYTVYVSYFMILVVFCKSLGIRFNHWWMWAIIAGVYILGSMLVGWLDYKLGIFGEEQRRHTSSNSMLTDMYERIKKISEDA